MNAPLAHTLAVPMPSAPITMAATSVIVMPVTNVAHGQPLKRTALILMSVLVTTSVALSALAQTKSVHMSVSATVATKRMYGQQRQTHAKILMSVQTPTSTYVAQTLTALTLMAVTHVHAKPVTHRELGLMQSKNVTTLTSVPTIHTSAEVTLSAATQPVLMNATV